MNSNERRTMFLLLAALAVVPALAQAPDCTGISDVSDFDGATVSNMDGFLTTVRVASGLVQPTQVVAAPGDVDRLFIVEQRGTVRTLDISVVPPVLNPGQYLDIRGLVNDGRLERGLLGLAFHPQYAAKGYFYVYYTDDDGDSVVARYRVFNDDPDHADESRAWDRPAS